MVKRLKMKQFSLPVAVTIGTMISIVISVFVALATAWLINTEALQIDGQNTIIGGTYLIAAFIGSWIAYQLAQKMRLIVSSITSGCYLLALCGITALVFGGEYEGFLCALLMIAIGMVLSILPGLKGKKSNIRRHKIPSNR